MRCEYEVWHHDQAVTTLFAHMSEHSVVRASSTVSVLMSGQSKRMLSMIWLQAGGAALSGIRQRSRFHARARDGPSVALKSL